MGTSTERNARSSAPLPAWRLQRWPTDATIGQLVVHDHRLVPTTDQVSEAVETSRRRGDRALRTSALFPAAAEVFAAAGFTPIDRLALLRIELPHRRPIAACGHEVGPPAEPRADNAVITPLRPWRRRAAAAVDRAAFGPMWGNSASSLRDTLRATPAHHGRVITTDRRLVAVAISGVAGATGYVQRVAVDPDHRRRGHALRLVIDGLDWMAERGATTALVNTGIANQPALALYHGLGFELLADQLVITERTAP